MCHLYATLERRKSCSLWFFVYVPQKRLQNNIVYIYLSVYVTVDVTGDVLKSLFQDNQSCLHGRLWDLVARKGSSWKRDGAQSWTEDVSCGKNQVLGKMHEAKEQYIYFPEMFHLDIESSEFIKFSHGQPVNQKWKWTGPVKQAAGKPGPCLLCSTSISLPGRNLSKLPFCP